MARRTSRPIAILVVALLIAGLTLAGCGGTKESPGGPSGTGVAPSSAQPAPASVRTAVLSSLKKAGVSFDASSTIVNYGISHSRAAVLGALLGKPGLGTVETSTGAGPVPYAEIDLTLRGRTWVISGSRR